MLTDHIRHTFGFDLARVLVFGRRLVFLAPVERGVADLMQHGFDRLLLAHAGAYQNFFRNVIEAAFRRSMRSFIQNGNRRNACDRVCQFLKLCNIAAQFRYADAGKLLALSL